MGKNPLTLIYMYTKLGLYLAYSIEGNDCYISV